MNLQFASFKHGDLREARQAVWALSRRAIIKRWKWLPINALVVPWVFWLEAGAYRNRGIALVLITYGVATLASGILYPLYAVDRAARRDFAAPNRPTTVTITDDQYIFDVPGMHIARDWSLVASAEERYGRIFLRNASGGDIGMMCAQCCGPQIFAQLRMLLVGRGVLPQAYKIKI